MILFFRINFLVNHWTWSQVLALDHCYLELPHTPPPWTASVQQKRTEPLNLVWLPCCMIHWISMLRSQRCTKQNQDTMNIKWIFSSQKETWTRSQVSWRLQVCHTSRFWPLKNSTSNPTDKRNCFLHPQSKWRVERGATEKRLQLEVRVDLNPGPLGYMSEAQTTRPRYLLLFIIFTNWSVGFLFNFCLLLLLLSVFFFLLFCRWFTTQL